MKSPHLLLIVIIFLLSCTGYDCARAETRFGFVGFSGTEANPVIFRKFEKGRDFSVLIDTILITPANIGYSFSGDTLQFSGFTADLILKSDFDYEMVLPNAGRTFRLGKIREEFQSKKWSLSTTKEMCVNPIVGYELDGRMSTGQNIYYVFLPR